MDEPRVSLEWHGQDREGWIKIGLLTRKLVRLPGPLRKWFDVWWQPPYQHDVRERPCDPKREMSGDEIRAVCEFIKPIGALARMIDDEVS